MTTTYPSDIDIFPTPGAFLSTNPHSSLHKNIDDAVIAIETKLGVDSSIDPTTIDYLLKNALSIDPGHKHTPSVSLEATGTPSATTSLYGDNTWKTSVFRFGGTGSDGALTVTSSTVIDLGGAETFVKNYTTISITSSGSLSFINPHANGTNIIFNATGNVIITSAATRAIDLRLLGGIGGIGVTSSTTSSGNGGRGSGSLLIRGQGTLNFTGTIDASGQNGADYTPGGAVCGTSAGGGAGVVVILTSIITANTGTITITAGVAGAGTVSGGTGGGVNGNNGSAGIGLNANAAAGTGGNTTNTSVDFLPPLISSVDFYTGIIWMCPGAGGGSGQASGGHANGTQGHSILGSSGTGFAYAGLNIYFT